MIKKLKINSIFLNTMIVSSMLISSNAFAEMPASAQKHIAKTDSSYKTNYDAMAKAHAGIKSNKPQPFWSDKQKAAQEVETKLLKAIKDNTATKTDYARLANLYLANNKTMKAIPAYQDAINKDETNAKLFAGLSIAYLHQSKYSMAKAMAEQAITLDPSMKHAMKIKEYITQKEEVIAQASKKSTIPVDSSHSTMPADSNHSTSK